MRVTGPLRGQGRLCESILRQLPAWFAIEKSIQDYAREVDRLDTFCIRDQGFLSLKNHFPQAAEIYVMGVLQRGCGLGSALLEAAQLHLRAQGVVLLQVKTLAASVDHAPYAQTRAFYQRAGFVPVEVFPDLWDPQNPCLLMVKSL
ncbi:GNAT family N-acetyltransferase [bacterium]|nr:GNAT family N-acetyltransferase [bacterium]